MKRVIMLIILFMLFGSCFSYEWTSYWDTEYQVYDMLMDNSSSHIFMATDQGLAEYNYFDEVGLYTSGDLPCNDVAVYNNEVYATLGAGSWSDGVYIANLETESLEIVDWFFNPNFLESSSVDGNLYVGYEYGLNVYNNSSFQTVNEFNRKKSTAFEDSDDFQLVATTDGIYHKNSEDDDALFASRQNFGQVEHNELTEISGLVASRSNPGVLWTMNDSGGGNHLYAMNELGQHLGVYTIPAISNRDWEDIAIGKNPQSNSPEIYLADMGDNGLSNPIKQIYVVPEASVSPSQQPVTELIQEGRTINFEYPNNEFYDSETLIFDQRTSTFYIVTKRNGSNDDNFERLFSVPYTYNDQLVTANYEGTFEIPADVLYGYGATGGDISPDGNFILIKTYQNVFMWERSEDSILNTLNGQRIQVPYVIEPQGEAVAWRYDGNGYFTASEEYSDIQSNLYFYSKLGWRKASNKKLNKLEYNYQDEKFYGIKNEGEDQGLYSSEDNGINWNYDFPTDNLADIESDAQGVIFIIWKPTAVPEYFNKVAAYYNNNLVYLNNGLENLSMLSLSHNFLLDTPTVLLATSEGVKIISDFTDDVPNQSNEVIELIDNLSIYPNPFNNEIKLSLKKGNIEKASLYNIKGQKLKDYFLNNKDGIAKINLDNKSNLAIPSGIYFLKVKSSTNSYISKIVKY